MAGEPRLYCRFDLGGTVYQGLLRGNMVDLVKGDPGGSLEDLRVSYPLSRVRLLPPVEPQTLFCIGRNYADHAKELGNDVPEEPLVFLKARSALLPPEGSIEIPSWVGRVDYEGELGVVIRKPCRRVTEEQALDYVLGYTCFNDVTARDLQKKDGQFTRAKGFDTFAAVGPCVATGLDPAAIRLKTFLNGKLVQSGSTADLIFSIPYLVRFLSRIMTLNPGDIIATGTPAGVGPVSPGDRVDVQIEGIGVLSNPFRRPGGKEDP